MKSKILSARPIYLAIATTASLFLIPLFSFAVSSTPIPTIYNIRLEYILFTLTLLGVALFHKHTMYVALTGLLVIVTFKLIYDPGFNMVHHIIGSQGSEGEWRILLNLLGLLFGFAILAKHFEDSGVPDILPKYLPNDWTGGLVLLFLVLIMSSFLDNIAAAMIGGTMAMVVYKGKVHMAFLVAIIAASNAGGAGSVVGDTTTTLMWIDGVSPLWVTKAFLASLAAFIVFGIIGALRQQRFHPIQKDATSGVKVDMKKISLVFFILLSAIATNYFFDFPAMGVWIAILLGTLFTSTPWHEMKKAWKGTIFLMALVTCASLMPVEELPPASWQSAFALGFVSAVFDNIPLTKLCLDQGGYDWGILAYTVGFGGSMIWFGSSAGVALSNIYPQTKNTLSYLKHGWFVIVAYVIGFFIMLGIAGWHPHPSHKTFHEEAVPEYHAK